MGSILAINSAKGSAALPERVLSKTTAIAPSESAATEVTMEAVRHLAVAAEALIMGLKIRG
jgi:hypothetical protein